MSRTTISATDYVGQRASSAEQLPSPGRLPHAAAPNQPPAPHEESDERRVLARLRFTKTLTWHVIVAAVSTWMIVAATRQSLLTILLSLLPVFAIECPVFYFYDRMWDAQRKNGCLGLKCALLRSLVWRFMAALVITALVAHHGETVSSVHGKVLTIA